jgi:hypothetical protein
LILASLTCAAPAQTANTPPIFEEWVVVVLDHKTCGYGSTITTAITTPSGPGFLTNHQEEFVVKRAGSSLKITETSKVTEDADGGVLSFDDVSDAGSAVEVSGVREGDTMVVSSRGQTERFNLPRLAALGPERVRRMTLSVPLKPGQKFSFDTFDPQYPHAVSTESGVVVAREMHDVRGVKRDLWRTTSEVSYMPGMLSTTWVDDQANDVESITVLPGLGTLHEYVTTREECMRQPEGAEVFTSTMIRPDRPLRDIDNLGEAIYRLVPTSLDKPPQLWDGGEQRILASTSGGTELSVTVPRYTAADAAWSLPHADTPELHRFLQPSAYLEVNSPEIQALGPQAVGGERNPVAAAHRIEKFVRAYITKKDLNIGFASAQETARSREGDCTEHAVLCAALGRAVGLPTRCVVGFGYIPPGRDEPTIAPGIDNSTGIFGFHMWAEAWIGPDEWVPMDAALGSFDVGHIAICKSALEEVDPIVDLNTPVLRIMEGLKIEVLQTVPKDKLAADRPPTSAMSSDVPTPPAPERRSNLPPLD